MFVQHREELELFASLVRGDESFAFVSLSYPEHWAELEGDQYAAGWLPELRARYDVAI